LAKKYPNKPRAVVLSDLVRFTPGDEGKWFAAAKDAKLFDEAVACPKSFARVVPLLQQAKCLPESGSGMPARTMLRMAVRRKSCAMLPGHPAAVRAHRPHALGQVC
jgi:hypothetical protein